MDDFMPEGILATKGIMNKAALSLPDSSVPRWRLISFYGTVSGFTKAPDAYGPGAWYPRDGGEASIAASGVSARLLLKEMLIYCHPGKNQLAKAKARFCLCLQSQWHNPLILAGPSGLHGSTE